MRSPYQELKERAWAANQEIPRRGLAIYTFGNVSALDAARGVMAIKPSGVEYEKLDGRRPGGARPGRARWWRDSSGPPPTRPRTWSSTAPSQGVGGVVHTHSTYATGWAQARMPIPIYGTTHADHLAEDVPCTAVMTDEAVERDYEVETGNQILEALQEPRPAAHPHGAGGRPRPIHLG